MPTVTKKRQRQIVDMLLRKADSDKRMPAEEAKASDVLEALISHRNDLPFRGDVVLVPFDFSVDRKGLIRVFSWGELLMALDGLAVSRIRQCEICNERFYAPRDDSRACSEKHTSTLRQREYRKTKGENE